MGQRANFEENYTGKTFQGSYIAEFTSRQDKSRLVENGYPEYFAKVLNAPNWIESILKSTVKNLI
jgi:maltose phosphorylase